jgi:ribulose-phosphate 3-epimerase
MPIICPTITAFDGETYRQQMNIAKNLSPRVHVDLMDGQFAPSVSPSLDNLWLPHEVEVDIHLMYQDPMEVLPEILRLRPHMVIIHNEVSVHHMHFAGELHKAGILTGLAILHDTPIEWAYQIMHSFDQVLIFSGHLGYHGGEADLGLLEKVTKVREHHPDAEIAWDGGINADNIAQLVEAGVEVLNVGGYIQKSDDPHAAYERLKQIIT